jgi:hypothetical protein
MDLSTTTSDVDDPRASADVARGDGGVWMRRRTRALWLAREVPAAEEALVSYADLVVEQARIAARVPARRWLALVDAGDVGPPRMRLDRLPVDELVPLFVDFLGRAPDLGTAGHGGDARVTAGTPGADWLHVLGAALARAGDDQDAPVHAVAFLEPIATTLAATAEVGVEVSRGRRCFVCGGPPTVGALRDLPGAPGSRCLVCGVCGSSWRLPRFACVGCGETEPEKLATHSHDALPWVALDSCRGCGRYLKTVDVRRRPDAVPVVDDIATREIDIWARQAGLARAHRNLVGL